MTYKILSNTYVAGGYVLSSSYTGLVIDGGAGVYGTGVEAKSLAVIENYGKVRASGSSTGVSLIKGGTVKNDSYIGGFGGIAIKGGAGTVQNSGEIDGNGGAGVKLYDGGLLDNNADVYAVIHGGVYVAGAVGTVVNTGTISGSYAAAIELADGGAVTNGMQSARFGQVLGLNIGVYAKKAATVTNFGTIEALKAAGVALADGGVLTNGTASDTRALLEGYSGVSIKGAVGTVTNFGTINGAGDPTGSGITTQNYVSAMGVYLVDGGHLTNGGATDRSALISGGYEGVLTLKSATVVNFGAILSTADFAETGGAGEPETAVDLNAGGSLTNGSLADQTALILGYQDAVQSPHGVATIANFGTIEATEIGKSAGIVLTDGGTVTNGGGLDTGALITGDYGAYLATAGVVANFATIEGVVGDGLVLALGGTSTNGSAGDTKALIQGAGGVVLKGAAGTLTNFGTILGEGAAGDAGVAIEDGGLLTNGAINDRTALVTGYSGFAATVAAATLVNFGTVQGFGLAGQAGASLKLGGVITNGSTKDAQAAIVGYVGVETAGVATVTNFGTITGFGGTAVTFDSASDVLAVEAGSAFIGVVNGDGGILDLASGAGTLLLAGAVATVSGSMALTSFSGFGTVEAGSGASFVVSGVNNGVLEADGGTLNANGAVTGTGHVDINGGVAQFGAGFVQAVDFVGTTGELVLGSSKTYTGKITGFSLTGGTSLDLLDITFAGATTATYSGTTASGTLTVTEGSNVAKIKLVGDYLSSTFTLSADSTGGTLVVDPAKTPASAPHIVDPAPAHPLAAAIAAFAASPGGSMTLSFEAGRSHPPAMALPMTHSA